MSSPRPWSSHDGDPAGPVRRCSKMDRAGERPALCPMPRDHQETVIRHVIRRCREDIAAHQRRIDLIHELTYEQPISTISPSNRLAHEVHLVQLRWALSKLEAEISEAVTLHDPRGAHERWLRVWGDLRRLGEIASGLEQTSRHNQRGEEAAAFLQSIGLRMPGGE